MPQRQFAKVSPQIVALDVGDIDGVAEKGGRARPMVGEAADSAAASYSITR